MTSFPEYKTMTEAQCLAVAIDPKAHAECELGGPVVECWNCEGMGGFGDPNYGEIDETCVDCEGWGYVLKTEGDE